jgi:membrane protease YdiL (CAAX protease family)
MENTADLQRPKLYGPIATILITVFTFFGSQIFAAIAISLIVPIWYEYSAEQVFDALETNPWLQFLFIGIVEAITLGVIYKFLKARKAGFNSIGLNQLQVRHLLQAAIGFVIYFVIFLVIAVAATALIPGLDTEAQQELGFDMSTTGLNLLPIFLSLVILPPIAEEIVARGFLYTGLKAHIAVLRAALITSLLFGAAHLAGGAEGELLWLAALDTFVLSMVLCKLKDRSNSLWPCIGVHMMKNGLAFVVLFNIGQYFR